MPLEVVIAEVAERDLESIWVHIAERNYDAADRLIDDLLEAFAHLAKWPAWAAPGMTCTRPSAPFRSGAT